MEACKGCGDRLSPMKYQGREKIWCSQACRARALRRSAGLWTVDSAPRRRCDFCDAEFQPARSVQKFCSSECGWRFRDLGRERKGRTARVVACFQCGAPAGPTVSSRSLCGNCRAENQRANNRRKNSKRRGAVSLVVYKMSEIAERDGWRCHICSKSVNKKLPGTDPNGPTIDHLVPISDGGADVPENVALAHRACNVRRGAGGIAQLRLTG